MARALSIDNLLNAKFKGLWLPEPFRQVIGKLELAGSWAVWGQSSSGKTTFLMQLAKAFSDKGKRVCYNSLEEGVSSSIKNAAMRASITKGDKIIILDKEPLAEMEKRITSSQRPPHVFIIDSLKYTRFNWKKYEEFKNRHPKTLFIWVMYAQGKEPKGNFAQDVRYDSNVKIYVEGYRAFVASRYASGDKNTIDVWKKGAMIHHGAVKQ